MGGCWLGQHHTFRRSEVCYISWRVCTPHYRLKLCDLWWPCNLPSSCDWTSVILNLPQSRLRLVLTLAFHIYKIPWVGGQGGQTSAQGWWRSVAVCIYCVHIIFRYSSASSRSWICRNWICRSSDSPYCQIATSHWVIMGGSDSLDHYYVALDSSYQSFPERRNNARLSIFPSNGFFLRGSRSYSRWQWWPSGRPLAFDCADSGE